MLRFHKLHRHRSLLEPLVGSQYRWTSSIPSERNWDPAKIYPNEPGQVRVCGITMRDGHQSLNGGMHRIDLLEKAAVLFDKLRPPTMQFPGSEEIGGGTTVDFPLRFKGEHPFRNMERISRHLPHTPTSVLIRSDSLCGYNINPPDVVDAFITRYAEVGIDCFRVFDAYNNPENQRAVSRAVLAANKHYQAAITFTSHADETLFNDGWVSWMAESFAKMGAHSICIKDMAGIASPAMMRKWVLAIKRAVPELPVHLHSHYTTGFAPISYLQGIEAGASAVDCAISTLSGRSGHPSMEVFNQTLHDLGYDLGWDFEAALGAMRPIADLYREYHDRYEFCEMKMAGAVDYRVFTQGIPGGQISIMRNELVRNGYGHLFDKVIDQIQRVRTQVGGVALVTPTSEHVARQSIVNAMNGQDETNDLSPLWPGYSEMLRGVMGRPPSSPDPELQRRALREWTLSVVKGMALEEDTAAVVRDAVPSLVDFMWSFSSRVRSLRDAEDVERRRDQLTKTDATKYAAQIEEAEAKLTELRQHVASAEEDAEYVNVLKENPSEATYSALVAGAGPIGELVTANKLDRASFLALTKAATMCTVCPSTILPDGMERSRCEIETIAVEKEFGVHDGCQLPERGTVEFEEWAILQCMFKHAQNIAQFWFQHNQQNEQFWDKNFPEDFLFDRDEGAPPGAANPTLYPFRTKVAEQSPSPHLIQWSDTELNRVFRGDIDRLHALQSELERAEALGEDNENRKVLKQRRTDKVSAEIDAVRQELFRKIKASLYNTQSHQAGYTIDIDESIRLNLERCQAL